MNDPIIRSAFHKQFLYGEHEDPNTLVIDELGLSHGKCRADIAVINGHLSGYEIKSDDDNLFRLQNQIELYNAVFDYASIITTERHFEEVEEEIPSWWGIICVTDDHAKKIKFTLIRTPKYNNLVDDFTVAQLLWKNETQEILSNLGLKKFQLRQKRSTLYDYMIQRLDSQTLRNLVRDYLKKRNNWRHPVLPSLYDD